MRMEENTDDKVNGGVFKNQAVLNLISLLNEECWVPCVSYDLWPYGKDEDHNGHRTI